MLVENFDINKYSLATLAEVKAALRDASSLVVDARGCDAYAGWSTRFNKLGGHIKGATDFSVSWLKSVVDFESEQHLVKVCQNKGIVAGVKVIIYDENRLDAFKVAEFFQSLGLDDISVFDLKLWDEKLVSYENYQLYVPPVVVADLLAGKAVKEIGEVNKLVVLNIGWGSKESSGYFEGHVPGAIHVNSDDFDDEENFYRLESDQVLMKLAMSKGIRVDTTVICSGSSIFACRYAVILKYLGVERVYVMSGGLNAWVDSGLLLEAKDNHVVPVVDFGIKAPKNHHIIRTASEVKSRIEDDSFMLVDNRTIEEYRGETSGYDYFSKAGRINGAVFGYAGWGDSNSMHYYENVDKTMRNAYEIRDMWLEAGIDIGKHLSFYCGGGYRAAKVFWDSKVMGLENTSLYADGWCGF